ncbi:MAG TPA: hypothetical protein VF720_11435 [Candidatus Eisenbacteria bacterium]
MTASPGSSRTAAVVGLLVAITSALLVAVFLHRPHGRFADSGAAELPDSLRVPIESRFRVAWVAAGPSKPRTDFSGIVVPTGPACVDSVQRGRHFEFWLADDKSNRIESMIIRARPAGEGSPRTLLLSPMAILNPRRLPFGDDMEDLARLTGPCNRPVWVAGASEAGPDGESVSWLHLFEERDGRLTLRWTGRGSPPGETVGNNGFEGVAMMRLGADTLVVLAFKERPDPTYVRSFLFTEKQGTAGPIVAAPAAGTDSVSLTPIEPIRMDRIDGLLTQAGACFGPSGDLYVLDRLARRIAVVDRKGIEAAVRDSSENRVSVREWLDFDAIESTLENKRDPDSPLSPFGTAEGIAFGPDGTLYLLADNNDAGPSTVVTLVPLAFRDRLPQVNE